MFTSIAEPSSQLNIISQCVNEIITKLIKLANNDPDIREDHKKILALMFQLSGMISTVKHDPVIYKMLIQTKIELQNLITSSNQLPADIHQAMKKMLEGFNKFELEETIPSTLANKKFDDEMDAYFKEHGIASISTKDIGELFRFITKAELNPNGKCFIYPNANSPSRRVINFIGIQPENSRKILEYMRNLGDRTAVQNIIKGTEINIEISGNFCYEKIMPLLKKAFIEMKSSNIGDFSFEKTFEPTPGLTRKAV